MNSTALLSFILGIMSLCTGALFGAPAWYLANQALEEIKGNPEQEGESLARAGKILGMLTTSLFLMVVLCALAVSVLGSFSQ
jgi:hypothetical protein